MNYLTVTALTKYIKHILETDKHLVSLALKGEISNFKKHSRGHFYFTLKDEQASINAIMFSSSTQSLAFMPKDGDHVLVTGKISLYEAGGSYSIQVFSMQLDGIGELYQKYEALKKDLSEKGYFDVAHKKKVPDYPKVIGVITSPTGAVIEDIKHTVLRRYPLAEIHLYPALVQGQGSKESLVSMIKLAQEKNEVDVLIIGRGGGSIEDLWSFNELEVVMAIFESKIPIIAAIGHETDYTLSDFVADLRAPTPTAAAELATPNMYDLKEKIKSYQDALYKGVMDVLRGYQREILYLDQRLESLSPSHHLKNLFKQYDQATYQLSKQFGWYLDDQKSRLSALVSRIKSPKDKIDAYLDKYHYIHMLLDKQMKSLMDHKVVTYQMMTQKLQLQDPLIVMNKGFALIKKDDHIVTSIKDVEVGDALKVSFKDGSVKAQILEKEV